MLSPLRELVNEIENNHKLLEEAHKAISEEHTLLLEFLGTLENLLFNTVYTDFPVFERINNLTTGYNNLIVEGDNLRSAVPRLTKENQELIHERNTLKNEKDALTDERNTLTDETNTLTDERNALMNFLESIESLNVITPPDNQSLQDRIKAVLDVLPVNMR